VVRWHGVQSSTTLVLQECYILAALSSSQVIVHRVACPAGPNVALDLAVVVAKSRGIAILVVQVQRPTSVEHWGCWMSNSHAICQGDCDRP